MTPEMTVDLFRSGIYIAVMMVTVIVAPGLLVGLLVAMFQAVTQINEMSLSFIPKLVVTLVVMIFTGPWPIKTMLNYTKHLISDIPNVIG